MNFVTYLKTSTSEINQLKESFLNDLYQEIKDISPRLLPVSQTFLDACEGGKGIRGSLVKMGYELSGAKQNNDIVKPALAYEVIHVSLLAHDDIIDQSPLRRGKPTVYQVLGGDHYGISQTICLGDIGFFLSMRLITDSNFTDKYKNQALHCFVQTMINTGAGEMLDVELPHLNGKNIEEDIITITKLKTARYTIVGPLQLGAILGGVNQKLLKDISLFGESLGIAFQIQDDILGVFGDEKTLGKSVTSDVEEGKATLLINHAQKHANKKQKAILSKYYGQGKISHENFKKIKEVFVETGALDYSQKKACQLVTQAKKVINRMRISKDHKELLNQMADFLVERQN